MKFAIYVMVPESVSMEYKNLPINNTNITPSQTAEAKLLYCSNICTSLHENCVCHDT
jgi:hypothetical protein